MVGVERGTSDTARRTSNGRKIRGWCICDAQQARPEGPRRNFGLAFWWWKGRKSKPVGWSRMRVQAVSAGPFICSRDAKNSRFLETGSRNMAETRNGFLVPNFLFNFYSVMGSTGTPSVLLSILKQERWQTTGQWRFFASLVACVTKVFQLNCVIFVNRARCR